MTMHRSSSLSQLQETCGQTGLIGPSASWGTRLHDNRQLFVEVGGVASAAGAQDQEAIVDLRCNSRRLDILTTCACTDS